MIRYTWCAMALAMAVLPSYAQEPELSELRKELRQLQQRIQELEKSLQQREASAPRAAPSAARPAGEAAFNPGITLILQGTAARSSRDPETYQISGFAPSGGEVEPARRGFSLAESELVISGNVDPLFRGQLVAALTPEDELEVE